MPKKSSAIPPKPAKGGKRERTRTRLIEAAIAVIREKGYDRATLEEVARRAGMTRGAIYNNFADKEDLLLAAAVTRWKPVAPPLRKGMSLKKVMRLVGRAAVEAVPERRDNAIGDCRRLRIHEENSVGPDECSGAATLAVNGINVPAKQRRLDLRYGGRCLTTSTLTGERNQEQ